MDDHLPVGLGVGQRSSAPHHLAQGRDGGFDPGVRLVRLPWDLVFERQRSGGQPPFSPVYLAALPLLAVGAVRDSRVRNTEFGLSR